MIEFTMRVQKTEISPFGKYIGDYVEAVAVNDVHGDGSEIKLVFPRLQCPIPGSRLRVTVEILPESVR